MKDSTGQTLVIVGGMYSAKTSTLLTKLEAQERCYHAQQAHEGKGNGKDVFTVPGVTAVFRPDVDVRGEAKTHCGRFHYRPISVDARHPSNIVRRMDHAVCRAIGIDEAQFFPSEPEVVDELVDLCYVLNERGIWVFVAGLNLTWDLRPFGAIPALMAHFRVLQLYSVCGRCGNQFATLSERLVADTNEVLVSEAVDGETYKPCCQSCHPLARSRVERFHEMSGIREVVQAAGYH